LIKLNRDNEITSFLSYFLRFNFNRKILLSQLFLLKNDANGNFFHQHHLLYNRYCYQERVFYLRDSELLPLVEVGASWEVCAFVSYIYLPSSLGSPYPVF